MSLGEKSLWILGAAMILLLVLVYFIGFSTDARATALSIRDVSYAVTGRTPSGQFADYPGGGSLSRQVLKQ